MFKKTTKFWSFSCSFALSVNNSLARIRNFVTYQPSCWEGTRAHGCVRPWPRGVERIFPCHPWCGSAEGSPGAASPPPPAAPSPPPSKYKNQTTSFFKTMNHWRIRKATGRDPLPRRSIFHTSFWKSWQNRLPVSGLSQYQMEEWRRGWQRSKRSAHNVSIFT